MMEYKSFGNKEKIRIGVIGIGRNTGETTVSLLITNKLNEMGVGVAFLELGNPKYINSMVYDKLGLANKYKKEPFVDFYKLINEGKRIRGVYNINEGVNWVLITPENVRENIELNAEDKIRLISNAFGEVIVVDCNSDFDVLGEMDYVIAIIDPNPSVLLNREVQYNRLREISVESGNVIWIVNKFNRGVNSIELNGFLKLKKYHKLKCFPPEIIYLNEYSCKLLGKNREISKLSEETINSVIKEMGIRGKHNK